VVSSVSPAPKKPHPDDAHHLLGFNAAAFENIHGTAEGFAGEGVLIQFFGQRNHRFGVRRILFGAGLFRDHGDPVPDLDPGDSKHGYLQERLKDALLNPRSG
jgi:hypothetical protein